MHEQLPREIDHLLKHIYESQDNLDTEEQTSMQSRRRLNVYIELEEEVEQPEVIESTLEQEDFVTCDDMHSPLPPQQNDPISESPVRHSRMPRTRSISLVLILFSLAGTLLGIAYCVLSPLLTSSATVIIVATASRQTTTSVVHVVHGTADPRKHQVAGRILSAITMSQAKTIPTTGTVHQDARTAHGFLTFYNAAPYIQTIPAGTLLIGVDGVHIVTDQDAIIPAAIMPIEGQVMVGAHAALIGPAGNIRAADMYGQCCRLNVFVANRAFSGGQNAKDYPTVTVQDLNGALASLERDLTRSTQMALQTQVHPEETLITSSKCNSHHTQSRDIGDEATQVIVTVDVTCTGEVYNTQALHNQIVQLTVQQANNELGTRYALLGEIQISIVSTHVSNATYDTVTLEVKGTGVWTYQFSQDQLMRMATMIAGKKKNQATHILLQEVGVHRTSINVTGSDTLILPNDPRQIHFLLLNETL